MSDDIDTLTGPELSAAVAREVMGWSDHYASKDGWWCDDYGHTADSDGDDAWAPHEDRNDAHRVLLRFGEIGGDWSELTWLIQGSEQGKRHFGMRLGLIVDPAIICRAALRAVREAKS